MVYWLFKSGERAAWLSIKRRDATLELITRANPTDSLDWPMMALGTVGAEFQVVSPPELVDRVRDWGDRFSRAAQAG